MVDADTLPVKLGDTLELSLVDAVPSTVMLAQRKVPPDAVAPNPINAPQKSALLSAAAGSGPAPVLAIVDNTTEITAVEEKLDVAFPDML